MTPAVLLASAAAVASGVDAPAEAREVDSAPPDIVVPAVHGLALMTTMRAVESVIWPDPFARTERFAASYERAFTSPPIFDGSKPFMQWDGDPVIVNAGGHALFGSELYLRARTCRFGWAGATAFTAATSALWEYGFEASGVPPSALDLVFTPIAGLVVGELRYRAWVAADGIRPRGWRTVTRAILDPFGEAERAFGTRC